LRLRRPESSWARGQRSRQHLIRAPPRGRVCCVEKCPGLTALLGGRPWKGRSWVAGPRCQETGVRRACWLLRVPGLIRDRALPRERDRATRSAAADRHRAADCHIGCRHGDRGRCRRPSLAPDARTGRLTRCDIRHRQITVLRSSLNTTVPGIQETGFIDLIRPSLFRARVRLQRHYAFQPKPARPTPHQPLLRAGFGSGAC
jgi:hypothetical protein